MNELIDTKIDELCRQLTGSADRIKMMRHFAYSIAPKDIHSDTGNWAMLTIQLDSSIKEAETLIIGSGYIEGFMIRLSKHILKEVEMELIIYRSLKEKLLNIPKTGEGEQ